MDTRRKKPADMAGVKRSRASHTGNINRIWDKLRNTPCDQPEEVELIKIKEIRTHLSTLVKTETGFNYSIEEAQEFAPLEEAEEADFQQEEADVIETFNSSLFAARELGEQLIAYKSVLTGIALFKSDLESLQMSLDAQPDQDHSQSLSTLQELFYSLREQWVNAELRNDHPIKPELDACKRSLTTMQGNISAAKARSDNASSSTSSSSSGSSGFHHHPHPYNELPKIKVPTFSGDLMGWRTFWSTFKTTVDDRKDLSNSQKLNYLRQAIKDPGLQMLLNSPIETAETYTDLVAELKERFQKPREIHRAITKLMVDLSKPKQIRSELRLWYDSIKCSIANLKSTKHYDIESFLSSFYYTFLPTKMQTLWDQDTQKEKGVPSIDKLLLYVKNFAETLPDDSTAHPAEKTPNSSSSSNNSSKKPSQKKKEPYHKPKTPQGVLHVAAPANSYRWECLLCTPEKHPIYICPKWGAFNLTQKLGHIQAHGLCSNCLSPGHATSVCKSPRRCRECNQMHHSSIHQVNPPTPINYSSTLPSKLPDVLLATTQVLLTGPTGQTMKARALIDSGAGLSIISKNVTQKLSLPLEPINLQLNTVQGETSKPLKNMTTVSISPLHDPGKTITCNPAVSQHVTCDLPVQPVEPVGDLPHIMGLQLADPSYATPGRIDLLLGVGMSSKIMLHQVCRYGTESQPKAQASMFGW